MYNASYLQGRHLSRAATRRSFRKSFFALALGASYGLFCAGEAGAFPGHPTIQNPRPPANKATLTVTPTPLAVTHVGPKLASVRSPTRAADNKDLDLLCG